MNALLRLPRGEAQTHSFSFVVIALRCAMAELSGVHASRCAGVWERLESEAPAGEVDVLFACIFAYARALASGGVASLGGPRTFCAQPCRDEWLAVSMIGAAQRGDASALLACARVLFGEDLLTDALGAARALARALAQQGVYVCATTADAGSEAA